LDRKEYINDYSAEMAGEAGYFWKPGGRLHSRSRENVGGEGKEKQRREVWREGEGVGVGKGVREEGERKFSWGGRVVNAAKGFVHVFCTNVLRDSFPAPFSLTDHSASGT
jgi:hypothetical protein